MSKSSEAFVGALGMKARNLGLSIETTAVARCAEKSLEDRLRVVAVLADEPADERRGVRGHAPVVERDRVEREPVPAVREDGLTHLRVVGEHRVPHRSSWRAPRPRFAVRRYARCVDTTSDVVHRGIRERAATIVGNGGDVPLIVWTAEDVAPTGLVLVGHGGSGHKREDYVVALARRLVRTTGAAVASIDGPLHGERRDDPTADPMLVLMEFAQAWTGDPALTDRMVADWHATVDALQDDDAVGRVPVGYWGVSMGTLLGLPYVASDPRVRACVLGLARVARARRPSGSPPTPHASRCRRCSWSSSTTSCSRPPRRSSCSARSGAPTSASSRPRAGTATCPPTRSGCRWTSSRRTSSSWAGRRARRTLT